MTAETFQQIARMATKEIQKDLNISLEVSKQRYLSASCSCASSWCS
jgi:hypothetical protein